MQCASTALTAVPLFAVLTASSAKAQMITQGGGNGGDATDGINVFAGGKGGFGSGGGASADISGTGGDAGQVASGSLPSGGGAAFGLPGGTAGSGIGGGSDGSFLGSQRGKLYR
jgi:hypothetical protein